MKLRRKEKEINIDVNISLDILLKKLDDMQSQLDETKKLLNAVFSVLIYTALDDIHSQESSGQNAHSILDCVGGGE